MKKIVITPTYNESKNILVLIKKIKKIDPDLHVLVIDDNSPDNTSKLVQQFAHKRNDIFIINRKEKLGLGTAYITGFKWAIINNYNFVIQMDADLSHDPKELSVMLEEIKNYDLIIGSRYINGVNVINWPMSRLLLSYFANIYSRLITGIPIFDLTGGFKCYKIDTLKKMPFKSIKSEGYSFQIETTFYAWLNKFMIKEIPITFTDRTVGQSKMSNKIIYEAIWVVLKLRFKRIFNLL
ncbi:MAG: dolichyl-phosphate beta-D-mannosyltransferase [Candidatus Marinimicrobia bacterium]|nr:dolichyl-phosphate beta-D-mannosyltransferase [Candidatus Neomarinimicrobiota bacterium]|tara:strand:- start:2986 stop:3699 length:714 start_codon:yes stop_codon:yes gene_type:complete